METLLQLQPFAQTLSYFIVTIIIVGLATIIYAVVGKICAQQEYICEPTEKNLQAKKLANTYIKVTIYLTVIAFLVYLPCGFISHSWEMYKNTVIYRVANSETADKTVENINLLMDNIKEYLLTEKLEKNN